LRGEIIKGKIKYFFGLDVIEKHSKSTVNETLVEVVTIKHSPNIFRN